MRSFSKAFTSSTLNSLQTHGTLRYPTPMFGFTVVKGLADIGTGISVIALKNVDLPTLGLPTIPTNNPKSPQLNFYEDKINLTNRMITPLFFI